MNQVHVKIHSWDEDSKSLIISFASDTTASSNPDDYAGLAYQPHNFWPDVTTSEDLMLKIAQIGKSLCEDLVRKETMQADSSLISMYSNLAGTSQTFNVADLAVSDPEPDPDAPA